MPPRSETLMVHFYRAVVAHMDVWRQRMDATTNWAAATAAGMITFTFSNPAAPHYILLLAFVFQTVFLFMESRRYQVFDLWRRRFRVLNRALVVPALEASEPGETVDEDLRGLALDMGRTVPHLQLRHALGYRARRNYGYLYGVTLLAWVMKLEVHPAPAGSGAALLERASIAFVPGWAVFCGFVGLVGAWLALALHAPTGDIVDWQATPSGWRRWRRGRVEEIGGADGQ